MHSPQYCGAGREIISCSPACDKKNPYEPCRHPGDIASVTTGKRDRNRFGYRQSCSPHTETRSPVFRRIFHEAGACSAASWPAPRPGLLGAARYFPSSRYCVTSVPRNGSLICCVCHFGASCAASIPVIPKTTTVTAAILFILISSQMDSVITSAIHDRTAVSRQFRRKPVTMMLRQTKHVDHTCR